MRAPLIVTIVLGVCVVGFLLLAPRGRGQDFWEAFGQRGVSLRHSIVDRIDSEAFELFNDVCIEGRRNVSQYENHALALGWQVADDSAHPAVGVMQRAVRLLRGPQPAVPARAYVRPGRTQVLVLTQSNVQGSRVVGCAIYDTAASGLPNLSELEEVLGAPTSAWSDQGIEKWEWLNPRAWPTLTMSALYIAEDSPNKESWGHPGLSFEARAVVP